MAADMDRYYRERFHAERADLINAGAMVLRDYYSPFGHDDAAWWSPRYQIQFVEDFVCVPRRIPAHSGWALEWWFVPYAPNLVIRTAVPTKGDNWRPWGEPHITEHHGKDAYSEVNYIVYGHQDPLGAVAVLIGIKDQYLHINSLLAKTLYTVIQR